MIAIVCFNSKYVNPDDVRNKVELLRPYYETVLVVPHCDESSPPFHAYSLPSNQDHFLSEGDNRKRH
jgi:hypothetical protein